MQLSARSYTDRNLCSLKIRLATWRSSYDESDAFINECYDHAEDIELKANLLRLRSRNQFMRNKFSDALSYTLQALRLLGVEMMANPTMEMADAMFEEVKNELLAVGFDAVLRIPRATDPKMDLAVSLLSEAGKLALSHARRYDVRVDRNAHSTSCLLEYEWCLHQCHWPEGGCTLRLPVPSLPYNSHRRCNLRFGNLVFFSIPDGLLS